MKYDTRFTSAVLFFAGMISLAGGTAGGTIAGLSAADMPPPAGAGEKQTVNKPDTSVTLPKESVLHEHPTLLQMLRRNNDLRSRLGLRPHRMSPALTRAAQNHANYMARTGDFNHYSNAGPTGRAQQSGYRGGVLENIAMGYSDVDTAFNGWQNSGAHWANMTSNTTDAGFGYQIGPGGACYWVAVYANGNEDEPIIVAGKIEEGKIDASKLEGGKIDGGKADDSKQPKRTEIR